MDDSKVLVLSDGTQPNINLTSDTATENSAKQKTNEMLKIPMMKTLGAIKNKALKSLWSTDRLELK